MEKTSFMAGNLYYFFAIIFILFALNIFFAYAESENSQSSEPTLTATISNPRMVLYYNLTDSPLVFENSVIAVNDNDFDVMVGLTPLGEWKDKISFEQSNFTLVKGERKEIFYKVTINEPGYYKGDIQVTFKGESETHVSLIQELEVSVLDKRNSNSITGNILGYFGNGFAIGAVVLIVFLIVLFYFISKPRSAEQWKTSF